MEALALIVGDEYTQTEPVLGQADALLDSATNTISDPSELEIAIVIAELGDSSRMYWQREAELEAGGSGDWYPMMEEEFETSPPAVPQRAIPIIAALALRYLGKLALADIAAGVGEAVAQDVMGKARDWGSVKAYAVGGSFAAAFVL